MDMQAHATRITCALFIAALSTTGAHAAPIRFGPPTWVDIQRSGAEPMINVDHRGNGRVFVDYLGGPGNAVTRSLDGGQTFRMLFDPDCAYSNATVHCGTVSGGGDSEVAIAPEGDNVYDADFNFPLRVILTTLPNAGDDFGAVSHYGGPLKEVVSQTESGYPWPDRPWLAAFGADTVYLGFSSDSYSGKTYGPANDQHAFASFIQSSTDGGRTWTFNEAGSFDASQFGPLVVDNTPGPHRGTVYQFTGKPDDVRLEPRRGQIAVSTDGAKTFVVHDVPLLCYGPNPPWMAIDEAGNAYALCTTEIAGNRVIAMSSSRVADAANATAPGSKWSDAVVVSAPPATTTYLGSIAAGSAGRVAIVYYGTDGGGALTDQPDTARWHVYLAYSGNALCQWSSSCGATGAPSFAQGAIDRRASHTGAICDLGPFTCNVEARPGSNLLDMLDVGYDGDGRIYATWTDDNTDGQRPMVRTARQLSGPSLLASRPALAAAESRPPITDAAADAHWPNRARGVNLPGADLAGIDVRRNAGKLEFRVRFADVTKFGEAIAAVTGPFSPDRLLLVVRFESADQEYFVAFEHLHGGIERAFSGRIQQHETGSALGRNFFLYEMDDAAGYTVDPLANTVTIRQTLASLGNPAPGAKLLSVMATTLIGPVSALETDQALPIAIDATRAVDYVVPAP